MLQFGTGGWRAVIADGFTKANLRLLAAGDDPLSGDALGVFEQRLDRRASREPLQYILGTQPFKYSLNLPAAPEAKPSGSEAPCRRQDAPGDSDRRIRQCQPPPDRAFPHRSSKPKHAGAKEPLCRQPATQDNGRTSLA